MMALKRNPDGSVSGTSARPRYLGGDRGGELMNWLLFILRHGWTSLHDYHTLMAEREFELQDDNSSLRELMR